MIVLRPYVAPTFMTVLGALAKVRQLKKRGFPSNLRNWRFVTVTFDRAAYPDPEKAYELGKRHLRQFVYELRKRYGIRRWCWKMEFHEPDDEGRVYPHFHLLLDYKRPIDVNELYALWGKGRVDIEGITNAEFDYLFKYVTKAVDFLPHWITSRTRVRLFQTSRGFFPTGGTEDKEKRPSPRHGIGVPDTDTQNNRPPRETIGERLQRWTRCVVSRSLSTRGGRPVYHLHTLLRGTWADLLVHAAGQKFARSMCEKEITITQYKIETTCLRILPVSLSLSLMASM